MQIKQKWPKVSKSVLLHERCIPNDQGNGTSLFAFFAHVFNGSNEIDFSVPFDGRDPSI